MTTFMEETGRKMTSTMTPEHQRLTQALLAMLNRQDANGSGLEGLARQFEQCGMGDEMKSWIGTAANKPISSDQIIQALGSDKVNEMAAHAGLPADETRQILAALLPQIVSLLTPEGKINTDHIGDAINALASKFNVAA
jgi:uncharacterized protein YidB (DUF937 family)